MSPSETTRNPMLRPAAQSITAVIKAPDCETKARLPASGARWEKLALRPMPHHQAKTVRALDAEAGPTSRVKHGLLEVASILAVITTAARVPLPASSPMSAGTVAGGVAMTARSGAAQRGDGGVARMAIYLAIFGIDEEDVAREAAGQQVGRYDPADAAGLRTGADERHGFGVSSRSKLRIVMALSQADDIPEACG